MQNVGNKMHNIRAAGYRMTWVWTRVVDDVLTGGSMDISRRQDRISSTVANVYLRHRFCRAALSLQRINGRGSCNQTVLYIPTSFRNPGYMGRKFRKFRTDEFDTYL